MMNTSQIIIALTMALYLVMTIGIGVAFSRRGASSTSEFYLGGRKLGPLVTAMSAEASDMSSYLLMGLPGLAYLAGLAEVSWTIIGLAVGTYLNFLLVSKRLRIYSERLGSITVPDYFSRRYGDTRHLLSLIAALVIIVFFVPYTASGFKAVGMLFGSLFGWDYHVSMLIGAAVIIGYTVLGGFLAVSTTDLIQSVFMTVALVIIVLFGVDLTKGYNWADGTAGSFGTLSIVSTLAWGLGYFGMPHILLRFMAIRDKDEIKTSRRIATVWVVVSMCVAVLIGVIGYSISAAGIIPMLGTSVESAGGCDEQSRRAVCRRGGRDPRGHSRRYHVYGGFPAAGGGVQRIAGHRGGIPGHPAQRKEVAAGGQAHRDRHRAGRPGARVESGQLRVPRGLLRLGGLRRGVRPGHAPLPVLEALQPRWRHRRHDHRRRHGLPLEIRPCAPGRRVRDL